jgi:hypothetical protein
MTFTTVPLEQCGESELLRMDGRFHRLDTREAIKCLDSVAVVRLANLLAGEILRNKQPRILLDDQEFGPGVVATTTVQDGQVITELTKATTDEDIEQAGERRLRHGDLLLTMDGEGSLGKAAVFVDDYAAIPDSHVGVLRLREPTLALAIACFLNSSVGQAQLLVVTTGSTGQTQVSRQDVLNLRIPQSVLEKAPEITARLRDRLRTFEPLTRRVRRSVCEYAGLLTSTLLSEIKLAAPARRLLGGLQDTKALLMLLERLRPDMF